MQLTLAQLRKLSFPYKAEEKMDLKDELKGFEDILDASEANISVTIRERGMDTYLFNFDITIDLTLEDSVSLKPIPYTVHTEAEEIFTTDPELEDAFLIDGLTLNTKEAVLTNILCNKPMSYTIEDFKSDPEPEEDDSKDDGINPAFASLKDLL